MQTAPADANAALYGIVANVVYERLTRGVERKRRHYACANSVEQLEPDCHDRYQDDVAAVRDDLIRNATGQIGNLEGWMVPRLKPVTIDAHRRRRGERGAHQRPRLPLPRWLDAALEQDPWLSALAVEILTWVGVATAIQGGLWPLGAWADRRAAATGEVCCTEAQVAADVERVLAAMRTNRPWFESFVERPLGHKQAPAIPFQRSDPDAMRDSAYLALSQPHEVEDARLAALAAEAVSAIEERWKRGEDLRDVVVDVLGVVFGSDDGLGRIDCVPGTEPSAEDTVALLLVDPATVERIVIAVMEILSAYAPAEPLK